jgi:hypothetical protein
MIPQLLRQVAAVVRLEMKKTFLARRGLWVYLLALAPVILYAGHSIVVPREQQRLARLAGPNPIPTIELRYVFNGISRDQLIARLGQPIHSRGRPFRSGPAERHMRQVDTYTDGKSEFTFVFVDGILVSSFHEDPETTADDSVLFATIFQYFDLRLAVFFGCVGIFINLFRGEMLDKSLHYYLLTPMRREVLASGKFLAGVIATVVIFTASTAVQFPAMLWMFSHAEVSSFMNSGGWHQYSSYLGVTVLACIGYGSIFLAVGLFFRNPVVPAAAVLIWESANIFLPASLKKLSLIYYLEALCPVVPPPDKTMPAALQLLISPPDPASVSLAITGILVVTIVFLAAGAWRARRLQINYSTE